MFINKFAHIFAGDAVDPNWKRRVHRHRVLLRRMSRKIQSIRRQLVEHRLNRLRKNDARLNPDLPKPMWVPLRKEDDRRALILNLNGLLCHVVETQYGDTDPPYSDQLVKYPINQHRYVLCHKDVHEFLDWCIHFFHVFVWSACRRPKLSVIIDRVFPEQKPKLAGVLSQEHCSKARWLVQDRQVFFKKLQIFWDLHPSFNDKNTLILDDSYYKVFENVEGTWLIIPQLYHQNRSERSSFLKDELSNWLFLWLQNEDRKEYTRDNAFEETLDQFSDDVVKKWYEEATLEDENRRKEEVWKRQQEADAEAERHAHNDLMRKQQEEASECTSF